MTASIAYFSLAMLPKRDQMQTNKTCSTVHSSAGCTTHQQAASGSPHGLITIYLEECIAGMNVCAALCPGSWTSKKHMCLHLATEHSQVYC